MEIPEDSAAALKLAQIKFQKGEAPVAKAITEKVLARNDASKPEALSLKIALLLKDGDLKGAEDTEDVLVILYPAGEAAARGSRLILDHYLAHAQTAAPAEKIKRLEAYLQRHPGGLLEKEVAEKIQGIRNEVRSGYEQNLREQLALAQGFIRQHRFDRARKELDAAAELSREA